MPDERPVLAREDATGVQLAIVGALPTVQDRAAAFLALLVANVERRGLE